MKYQVVFKIVVTVLLLHGLISVESGGAQDLSSEIPSQRGPQWEIKQGVFVVADPQLLDLNFTKTVVLIIHHGLDGTLGVVINRPTTTTLSRAFPDVKEFQGQADNLYIGGPVFQQVMLLLLRSRVRLQSANQVLEDVYFSQDLNTLTNMLKKNSQKNLFRIYAGYAGWASGQLQNELDRGDWRIIRADSGTVFEQDSETVWPEMIRRSSEQLIKELKNPVLPMFAFVP